MEYTSNYSNYYIAYIDLLGMTELIKNLPAEAFNELCSELSKIIEGMISSIDSNKKHGDHFNIEFHMFSDNIIFFNHDAKVLIDFIALLQRRIYLLLDLFLKGAITEGPLYYDKGKFILGKGLLKSYLMESTHHKPLIYIDTKIADKYVIGDSIMEFEELETIKDHILTDKIISETTINNTIIEKRELIVEKTAINKKMYAIDYLYHDSLYDDYDFRYHHLPKHKKLIEENISIFSKINNIKVLQKYIWLKEYHNSFCRRYGATENLIK